MAAFKGEILMRFHIEAMTCGGCAGNVVKAIHSVDPNAEITTDPPTRSVQVTSSATRMQLETALCQAGYPPRGSDAPVAESVVAAPAQEMPSGVSMQVEGMDCASCVGKIQTALARMPGVSDIRLNFATERLELTLTPESPTRLGDIEKTIKSLGFGVSANTNQSTTPGIG